MAVLDWLQELLGGGQYGDPSTPAMSTQPLGQGQGFTADVLSHLQDVVSGKVAAGGALGQNNYDPRQTFAQNALNPAAIEQATDVAMGVGPGAIRAYHGSPHSFDRFDISKIGTGEGAQAYGHGLYFAENEGVARGYRDALAPPPAFGDQIGNAADLVKRFGNEEDALTALQFALARNPKLQIEIDAIKSGAYKEWKPPGYMYEVDIHADPKSFLDWDKPLYRQPSGVQEALGWTPKLQAEYAATEKGLDDALLGALRDNVDPSVVDVFSRRANDLTRQVGIRRDATGGEIYEHSKLVPGGYRDPPAASAALRELGIPGIRYLDQGSRQYQLVPPSYTGEQWRVVNHANQLVAKTPTEQGALDWMNNNTTSNYAMFDPTIVEIRRKYGLLPPVAAGGGLLAAGQESQP